MIMTQKQASRKRVSCAVGFDPGIRNTGWGVVMYNEQKFHCVDHGVITTA